MSDKKGRKVHFNETTSLPLTTKSQGIVYEDPYKKIEKITAEFDGFSKEYFVSDFGEKAAVLAFRDNCVLLTRQYRLLINRLSYEVPGGKVENGENPKDTAIRECFEETGIRCSALKPLITYDLDLEYTKNLTHVFYTQDIKNAQTQLSGKHEWLPFNDCLKMIEQRIITDSLSIITILAYKVTKDKI